MQLDPAKAHYIRLERVPVNPQPDARMALLRGTIKSREYYGMYIKYTVQTPQQAVRSIVRNDGISIYEPGQEVSLGLNPLNVMSYPLDEEESP